MKECVILFTARSKIMNYVEEIEKINTKISEAKGATKTLNEQYEILLKEKTDLENECQNLYNCLPKMLKEKIDSLTVELEEEITKLNQSIESIENESD